jgi:hypothetical protein
VSIENSRITRSSKARWVGVAAVVVLQSSAPAFGAPPCDPEYEQCSCSVGDPHLITENGVPYDFQGAGEFILLRDPNGLEIQTRQTPVVSVSRPGGVDPHSGLASCVSLNTAVAVRLGKRRVSYGPKWSGPPEPTPSSLELRVDGKLETLGPGGLVYPDGSTILRTASPGGLMITFPDRSTLQVTPGWWPARSTWYLNFDIRRPKAPAACACPQGKFRRGGLLGAIPAGAWLPALPDGSSMGPKPSSLHDRYVALYQKFADSWRVNDQSSLFDYAPSTSTRTFTTRSWPPEQGACAIPKTLPDPPAKPEQPITETVATNACRNIADEDTRRFCIFDVKVTGDVDFAKTYVAGEKDRTGSTKITLNAAEESIDGTLMTFVAKVTPLRGAKGPPPTGTVHFWSEVIGAGLPGKVRTSVKLDAKGQATWSLANPLKVASHTIMALFEPAAGSGFVASSSQAFIHTVVKK